MQIRITKAGIYSSIQGLGRWAHLSEGVPLSGAMDTLSARIANIALGNPERAALIEFTYGNAAFKAEEDLLIAYSGSGATLHIGKQELPADRPLFIPKKTSLHWKTNPQGCRTYLAVAGGWDVPEILGDTSTYVAASFGGFQGRTLQVGDQLRARKSISPQTQTIWETLKGQQLNFPDWQIARRLLLAPDHKLIRVIPAHEFTWFQGGSLVDFLSRSFTVSLNSNRMGYHLDGAPMKRLVKEELLSTAVAPGTIQVTGDGSLILLMADCQTTGGYPRLAQVAAVDLPLCGQLKPGDQVRFTEISRKDAERLYLRRERSWSRLRIAISLNT